MALDYNPDREGHVDHKYIVINATKQPKKYIEAGGRKLKLSKEGWCSVKDPALANEIRQGCGSEVTVSRVRNPGVHDRGTHNYFFAFPKGLPWAEYDDLGRRKKE